MAKRTNAPPLYELMSRRGPPPPERSSRPEPAAPAAVDSEVHPGPWSAWLGAGRVLRLPMGWVFLAGAGVLGLVIVAYTLGAWRGKQAESASIDQRLLEAGGGFRADDPLARPDAAPPADVDPPGPGSGAPASPPGGGGEPETAAAPAQDTPAGWGPVASDPREPGRHYFTLAETRIAGAVRLAEFCRGQGLEAYVVPGHNPRFRRVVIEPGFDTGSMSDPVVRRWKREILLVGRAWKERYPAESDLSDAYLERAPN